MTIDSSDTTRPSGQGVMRTKMWNEEGAINYLMIALLALLALFAVAVVMGALVEVVAVVLIIVGLLTILQLFPMLKGWYGIVAGLILMAVGAYIWFVPI